MTLKSMTNFILWAANDELSRNYDDFYRITVGYAEFMKQTLVLGMFIPCTESNTILNPVIAAFDGTNQNEYNEYLEAKERVLFKNFEFISYDSMICVLKHKNREIEIAFMNNTIERFQIYYDDIKDIELTKIAIKSFEI